MNPSSLWKQFRAALVVTLVVAVLEAALAWLLGRQDVLANVVSARQYGWLGLIGLLLACRLLLYFVLPAWLLWRVAHLRGQSREAP